MDAASQVDFEFEAAFTRAAEQLADVSESLASATKAIAAAKKAAALGDVASLSKGVQAARIALENVGQLMDATAAITTRDFAEAMRSGNFGREVVTFANRARLTGVRVVHGVICSFPVVVTPHPDKLAIRVGKKLTRILRPSALVTELEKLRKRKTSTARLTKLLEAIERAYLFAASEHLNMAVKIDDLYDALTPLPDQKTEYTELDFITDLYALERENILETSNKRVISFPASTGTRGGKAIRITTETGEERLYSSIRFE